MSAKKTKQSAAEKNLENIGEALSSTEQFLEKNHKSILIGLLIVVLTVGAFLAFHYLYKIPVREKAQAAIFKGERYFLEGKDSIAIFGNSNDYIGFEAIIKQYRGTKTADLAHAYAGISYSRMGKYEDALKHLKKFKGGDILVTPSINGTIADIYMNMGETEEAISLFIKAAKKADNDVVSPIYYKKAGEGYIHIANYDKAIEMFTLIKENYPESSEGRTAEKYIKKAELLKETN